MGKDNQAIDEKTVTAYSLVENEATFVGRISLTKFKVYIEKKASEGIEKLDFHGNGYVTDALLRVLRDVLCNKSKRDKNLAQLTTVDLTGCFNITDVGVGWLAEIVKEAPKLSKVILDGCTNLTDGGVSALQHAGPTVSVSAMATSVIFTNLDYGTQGCPLLIHPNHNKERVDMLYGQCLVVPQKGLDVLLSEYLQKKLAVTRDKRPFYFAKDWKVQDWILSLSEMELSNPLFDILLPPHPAEVVIPFDAAADVKDIRVHIANTITRVLSKETLRPSFMKKKPVSRNRNKFLDIHHYSRMELSEGGFIKSVTKPGGLYVSRQPLSRTNAYFETTVKKVEGGGSDTAIIIGCLFEAQIRAEQPSTSGAPIEKFDLLEGDVVGFGVEGEWDSEYSPGPQCKFYWVRNGCLVMGTVPTSKPCRGMYPLLTFPGRGEIHCKLENFNSPLKEGEVKLVSSSMKTQFEPGFTDMLQYDEEGILTYDMSSKTEGGVCYNKLPITKDNPSCTIYIKDLGENGQIGLGLGRENVTSKHRVGQSDETLGLRGDDGKIYYQNKVKEDASTEMRTWKKGDRVTITVTGFEDHVKSGDTLTMQFSIGETKVAESQFKFSSMYGNRCSFIITMHSKGAVLQIEGFTLPYLPQPPVMDKLTMGRANFMDLTDDGTLVAESPSSSTESIFMSKTPLNKSLPFFEVKIMTMQNYMMVGLYHWNLKTRKLGSVPGTAGYYREGKLYKDGETGVMGENKPAYEVGDIIGCGVQPDQFTSDGRLRKHKLSVYFTKNGTKVYETELNFKGDKLYPCIVTYTSKNSVKLLNYYPGCFPPGYKPPMDEKAQKVSGQQEKVAKLPEGCHFVLLGVGSGSVDEKAKVQQVKGQMDLDKDLSSIPKLKTEIQRLETSSGSLDFQGQNYYSRLCWSLECLERVCRQRDRLHFLSLNTKTGEGYESLLKKLVEIQENQRVCYPAQYSVHSTVKKGLDNIVSATSSKCILRKVDNVAKSYLGASNTMYPVAVKLLHSLGRMVCVKLNSEIYGVDYNYIMKSLFEKLGSVTVKTAIKDKGVMSVEPDTPLWTFSSLLSKNFQTDQNEVQMRLLHQMGYLELPVLRTIPVDSRSLYTRMDSVVPRGDNMSAYWSKGSRPENTVLVGRTYQFPAGMPSELLSTALSMCGQFARLQLVLKEGGVLYKGAVQTTIVQHSVDKADALTIECKCFMPDREVGPLNGETRYHVEEYTWNVFCILADVIDDHLENCGITPIIKENVPKMLPKSTVGCRHEFTNAASDIVQSVCTMCDQCCSLGSECKFNGIMGQYLRQCLCGTRVSGCKSCGICQRCAQKLWNLKSRLRPCCEITLSDESYLSTDVIPLNGVTFDGVDVVSIGRNQPVCLKKNDGGSESLIQVHPGPAIEFKDLEKLFAYQKKTAFTKQQQFLPGDTLTISLTAIRRDPPKPEERKSGEDAILAIEPVYYSSFQREIRIWHETGILCYDSINAKSGRFVAPKPLTAECNKFAIVIVNSGRSNTSSMGLIPRDYPEGKEMGHGADSVSLNAYDGGIYHGRSPKVTAIGKLAAGDVVSCELDMEEQIVIFCKGGDEVYRLDNVKIPPGGLFPTVVLKSDGECVGLQDPEPWLPLAHGETPPAPAAFDTCKYANLWISPGHSVYLHKTSVSPLAGWLLFHNPTSDLIGYVVTSDPPVIDYLGQIDPRTSKTVWVYNIASKVSAAEIGSGTIEVIWFTLNAGKTYSSRELKDHLKTLTSDQYSGHMLKVKVDLKEEAEGSILRKVSGGIAKKDMYELHVLKNDTLMEKYYLKGGNYACVMPTQGNRGAAIMRHTKHPTFDLPAGFKRGMRVVGQPNQDGYNECVITSCSVEMATVTLEYTPPDSVENEVLEFKSDSKVLQLHNLPMKVVEEEQEVKDTEKGDKSEQPTTKTTMKKVVKADIEIKGYESRGNLMVEKRGVTYPAPYLLSEASVQALLTLDARWKYHCLEAVGKCDYMPTRITVQEMQITELAKTVVKWTKMEGHQQVFVFLPSSLDIAKLSCSSLSTLYKDTEVHRLCYIPNQTYRLRARVAEEKAVVELDSPIHFVDTPAVSTQNPLPFDVKFGNHTSGWVYTALIATMVRLPVFDQFFSGGKPELSRERVETLLWSLLRMYAAQAHILSEQHGGMDLQEQNPEYVDQIQKQIANSDKHIVKFESKLVEGASSLISHDKSQVVFCKAHQLNIHRNMWNEDMSKEIPYEHKYFEPYHDTVNSLVRELSCQQALPEDFFPKFANLQYVCLEGCNELQTVPSGMSKCERLKVAVFMKGAIENLPEDLFLTPNLDTLKLMRLPVTTLPSKLPPSSCLTRLTLKGLRLMCVPPVLGSLKELVYLDLSYNPLVDVPHDLRKLQKLKHLNLSGMPWPNIVNGRTALTLDKFQSWHNTDPYVKLHMKKDMDTFFDEHDMNRNGVLDEEELSALNLKLFWEIPRLGSHCITDSEFGGIPPAVFQMTSLEQLHLNNTAITCVPGHICRLVNLQVIHLEENPLLESLPGSMGHMPNLTAIRLNGCPSLRTPPSEVVSRGFESVKAYLKRLAGGYTACRRTKLMLVGLGGAGKTSLLKALMSGAKKTEGTKGEEITDGIVIQQWKASTSSGEEISYSAWDFAGQTLYYNTHQFFLSKRAVYMLLWSTRQGFEHAGLEFWLSSIACHAPKTPIFIIGTHCDKVPKADIPMAELMKTYPQIVGFHFVSSLVGTGIQEMEKQLLKVTLEQKNMGEKIPQVWLNLEKKILEAREKDSILPWSKIKAYGVDVGLYDDKDIKEAVEFLHELGTVQYFDNEFLRDHVVINPQWIVNVMSCVVSVKNSPIQEHNGRLLHKHVSSIWREYPKSLHKWLLQLTEEFDLTFPLPKDPVNIVPCLLPQEEPKELNWPTVRKHGDVRQTKMVYRFSYLPAGLFNRAQVRLFQLSDSKLIWKRGSLLKKNNHLALIRQINNFELVVLVQGPRPENILFLVHEVFEGLIEESFHGVVYDFMVPCPDCVLKEACLDPSLFDSKLVYAARDHKAPFLQCRKYFHTVSMSQLIESMPDAQDRDFDASLQHSIMMLQELNNAMTTDVGVLYSAADMPGSKDSGDKIHPHTVKKDLEKGGYSVWMCPDMKSASIQDITLGLKNCKVVVALLSDNFEKDEKCRTLMLYAMNVLHKAYVILVVGKSMAWTDTDLGMRIGWQELMVMAKTKSRYQERVKELMKIVGEKLQGSGSQNMEYPVCFVSYCWSNSKQAVANGTTARAGSVGWGDPRDLGTRLEQSGISTWIDHEKMEAGKGLFENITRGMRHAKVLVACVSDQYAESENCMMELRFGVLNLKLPLILVVVGTGSEWLYSEAAALALRAKAERVVLQEENSSGYKTIVNLVKQRLPDKSDNSMRKESLKKEMSEMQRDITSAQTSVVFQEEYELTQRRFMRHLISFVSSMDSTPMPRLAVIDFERSDKPATSARDTPTGKQGPGSRPTMRPKTASKTRDRIEMVNPEEEEWEMETFCVKLLCEFEEGWHLCEQSFTLKKTETFLHQMKKIAPYLARTFAILKQSALQLNCFNDDIGKKFLDWLEKQSQDSDFLEAYQAMREIFTKQETAAQPVLAQLSRCFIPSGKVFWLCKEHQSGPRVTKLSDNVRTHTNHRRLVTQADVLLKERIEKSPTYQQKLKEKTKIEKIEDVPKGKPKSQAEDSKTGSKEETSNGNYNKEAKEDIASRRSVSEQKTSEVSKTAYEEKKKTNGKPNSDDKPNGDSKSNSDDKIKIVEKVKYEGKLKTDEKPKAEVKTVKEAKSPPSEETNKVSLSQKTSSGKTESKSPSQQSQKTGSIESKTPSQQSQKTGSIENKRPSQQTKQDKEKRQGRTSNNPTTGSGEKDGNSPSKACSIQ